LCCVVHAKSRSLPGLLGEPSQDLLELLQPALVDPDAGSHRSSLLGSDGGYGGGMEETMRDYSDFTPADVEAAVRPALKIDAATRAATDAATDAATLPTIEEYTKILDLSVLLYEQGYAALDIIDFIHTYPKMNELKRYELLIMFDKVRKEFRNEKLLMLYLLHFVVFRCKMSLENISFM
jgi:hypothetical protein